MGHDHHHRGADYGRVFAIGIVLNFAFVFVEATYGVFAHSLALVADAGHNLSDVLGLGLAWGATILARTPPSERRTYGWGSSSIFAALLNAIMLLIAVGGIVWEALRRLHAPEAVGGQTMIGVAMIGLVINTITAMMFFRGRHADLNLRAAFVHMAADAVVSAGVIVAGAAILFTGWLWVDPVVSLLIAGAIVWGTWDLLTESINLALHGVPARINLAEVRNYLSNLPHVTAVHDLHIWPTSTTETALTAHLVRNVENCDCTLLAEAAAELKTRFEIGHATLQFEMVGHRCELASPQEPCGV
ncbi:MAG: cation diffusion facilitator family transporter [Verrucomicrobiota bacterium]|nr:cation diffusion facilitator family transporter [Verrucomicrobiota bacterium]